MRVFTSDEYWFSTELAEITRKGATSALHGAKFADLEALLDQSSLDFQSLRQATYLLKTVRDSCRSQLMAKTLEKFAAPWHLTIMIMII